MFLSSKVSHTYLCRLSQRVLCSFSDIAEIAAIHDNRNSNRRYNSKNNASQLWRHIKLEDRDCELEIAFCKIKSIINSLTCAQALSAIVLIIKFL